MGGSGGRYISLPTFITDLRSMNDTLNHFPHCLNGLKIIRVNLIRQYLNTIELNEIENAMLAVGEIESACCIFDEARSMIIAVYVGGAGFHIVSTD